MTWAKSREKRDSAKMAGNSKSQKIKEKIETRYGIQKRATSITALKMIMRLKTNEKLQLEE